MLRARRILPFACVAVTAFVLGACGSGDGGLRSSGTRPVTTRPAQSPAGTQPASSTPRTTTTTKGPKPATGGTSPGGPAGGAKSQSPAERFNRYCRENPGACGD